MSSKTEYDEQHRSQRERSSGTIYVVGLRLFRCLSSNISFRDGSRSSVVDHQVTLASKEVNNQAFSLVANPTAESSLNETYSITGGCGDWASATLVQHGSLYQRHIRPPAGSGGSQIALSIALAQKCPGRCQRVTGILIMLAPVLTERNYHQRIHCSSGDIVQLGFAAKLMNSAIYDPRVLLGTISRACSPSSLRT
jgi:hypothetical protein